VIDFTDRYGGNPPSWLTACLGECEATGMVPVNGKYLNPRLFDPTKKGDVGAAMVLDDEPMDVHYLAKWTEAHGAALRDEPAHDQTCDGWHFLPCVECRGSGKVPRLRALARVPSWLGKGVKFIFMAARHREYRAPWMGAGAYLWLLVKCAYLYDLGWRR
jgi:hypothetical protein